ncbi:MAG: putative sulfate/molybdate transporter [bacterium]|nr:putative sulfate/molybdate transporter [bacterium]
MEFSGSLGDLGTLLPMAMGMILINGLDPAGSFLVIGCFYVFSGIYFGVTVPVQPMKVIGAYAIATNMTAAQISASGFLVGFFLLIIGVTNAISIAGKYIPKPVIKGVQLSTGVLLMAEGVRFITGGSKFQILHQAAEPFMKVQSLGPVPIGILIGVTGGFLTLLFLENRTFPAGLVIVAAGVSLGVVLGTHQGLDGAIHDLFSGLNFPSILPFGFPKEADFTFVLLALVLPQIPMTVGNAVVAYVDLSHEYFQEDSRKVTLRSSCISMAMANFAGFFLGAMPLCHGAGGLAAHYRFGARTAGSNLIIGTIFIVLAVFFGPHVLSILYLVPISILGILLFFAGSQLSLEIIDMKNRKDLFVSLVILGVTLASNLAVGFILGIGIAYALKSDRLKI